MYKLLIELFFIFLLKIYFFAIWNYNQKITEVGQIMLSVILPFELSVVCHNSCQGKTVSYCFDLSKIK